MQITIYINRKIGFVEVNPIFALKKWGSLFLIIDYFLGYFCLFFAIFKIYEKYNLIYVF